MAFWFPFPWFEEHYWWLDEANLCKNVTDSRFHTFLGMMPPQNPFLAKIECVWLIANPTNHLFCNPGKLLIKTLSQFTTFSVINIIKIKSFDVPPRPSFKHPTLRNIPICTGLRAHSCWKSMRVHESESSNPHHLSSTLILVWSGIKQRI